MTQPRVIDRDNDIVVAAVALAAVTGVAAVFGACVGAVVFGIGAVANVVVAAAVFGAVVFSAATGAFIAVCERRSSAGVSEGRRGNRVRPSLRRNRQPADNHPRQWLRAFRTADRLVDHLLAAAVQRLPEPFRDRYTEEWHDHRSHLRRWKLLWWALCLCATASRTADELQQVRLPRPDR